MRQRSGIDTPVREGQERMSNARDARDEPHADGIDDRVGANGTVRQRLIAAIRTGLLSPRLAAMVRGRDLIGGTTHSNLPEDVNRSKCQCASDDSLDAVVALPPLSEFADRLNRLFELVHRPGQGPYTSAEVVDLISIRGVGLSAPYLSQLRRGTRHRPSAKVVESLAFVFGVQPVYLTGGDPAYSKQVDRDLGWAQVAQDESVRELITSFLQLPDGDRDEILSLLDQWHRDGGCRVS